MASLTPQSRKEETSQLVVKDGLISGFTTLVPCLAGLWAAMKNPKFVKATNWQSRTALVVMPPLFVFAFTAESKLHQKMQHMAAEAAHAKAVSQWAEQQQQQQQATEGIIQDNQDTERKLLQLYTQSVLDSGVRIVEGDRLGVHHQIANYWQEHPFKMLAFLGVPSVLYIFNRQNTQGHLPTQMKILHTRVFGQFAVISLLLSLMGFKEYMDRSGTFITQAEADRRVRDMQDARAELLTMIEVGKKQQRERAAAAVAAARQTEPKDVMEQQQQQPQQQPQPQQQHDGKEEE